MKIKKSNKRAVKRHGLFLIKMNGLMIFFFCIFVILFPYAPFLVSSYIPLSWNKETPLVKSNFLSSQMKSHSCSPSSLPLHKAKWVQLNGKTLQVLKNSLVCLISLSLFTILNFTCVFCSKLTIHQLLVCSLLQTLYLDGYHALMSIIKMLDLIFSHKFVFSTFFSEFWFQISHFCPLDLCEKMKISVKLSNYKANNLKSSNELVTKLCTFIKMELDF